MLNSLSQAWSWNPGLTLFLLVLLGLYVSGLWRVNVRHARNPQEPTVSIMRRTCFLAGLLLAAFLLLTPVNTIARTQLFSVHMAQIVLLSTVCAPMILAGCPEPVLRPLTTLPFIRHILRFFTQPLLASILFNATFLLWHIPEVYNVTMANVMLYNTIIGCILFTSLLNWSPLIGAQRGQHHMSYPLQMAYAFFDGQPVDIFAFILVFTQVTLYTHYAIPPQLNFSSFGDQATGGALLLVPGLVDLGVMTPLFFRWLMQIEQKTRLADQRRQAQLEADMAAEEEEEEEEVCISPAIDRAGG